MDFPNGLRSADIRRIGLLFRAALLRSRWVGFFVAGSFLLPSLRGETTGENRTLSPYFWVKPSAPSDSTGSVDALPLRGTEVEATIAGIFAHVTVTQRYKNTGAIPLEAVYVFPGSTRAAVHGLTLKVGERRIEAKAKERGEARRTYEAAKIAGKTASLLEQQRPNVFQMNVANILPGDDIEVQLRYTELLVPQEGAYEFVYPGVVGPRYSNTPAAGAPPEARWVENPYLTKGTADPATYAIRVSLASGVPLKEVRCRSHRVQVDYRSEREAKVETLGTDGSNRDFILTYRLTGSAIQSGLMLAKGEEENAFLLLVQPPARPAAQEVPPREFIFVVDVSGSMAGFPLKTAQSLMSQLLGKLRPQDRFNVLLFAGDNEVFAPASIPASPEAVRAALELVGRQSGGGGTELLPALKRALSMPRTEDGSRTFVVITDGYVSIESEAFGLVRTQLGRANLFAFGIGSAVNRFLIEGLARAGQGEPFVVTDPEVAPEAARAFADYVSTPLLTKIAVEFDGMEAYDVEPLAVPDLLASRPLVVFGKWRGPAQGAVRVSGQRPGEPYWAEHKMTDATVLPDAEGLLRLWARSRIAELNDRVDLERTEALKADILALGLKYNLLTRYTSFVAVDEEVRRTTPGLRTVKQPLPLPSGVENSAVGGTAVAAGPEPSTLLLVGVAAAVGALAIWRQRIGVRRTGRAATLLGASEDPS